MARWDKFLEGVSKGYGLGFNRYQLYDEARRERQNRSDAQAAMDAYNQAIATPNMQFEQGTVYGPGQSVNQIRAAQTAVPTGAAAGAPGGAVPPPPRPRALEADEVPSRFAGHQADTWGDIGKDYADVTMEEIGRGPKIPPKEPDNYIMAPGKDGQPKPLPKQPPKEAVVVDEAKANKKTETNEALMEIVPRNIRKAIGMGETGELTGDAGTRIKQWDTVRDKLGAIYARNGDIDGLMSLDSRIMQMQQDRMLRGLEDAIRLVEVDPQAAARSLYTAYSYFPDGVDIKIAVQDGQLVGYGYDEETNKFRGAMPLNTASLARLYESIKDPVGFQTTVRNERIAAAERQEESRRWGLEYTLKAAKEKREQLDSEVGRIADRATALYRIAQAYDLNDSSTQGWETGEDKLKYMTSHQDHLFKMMGGKYPTGSLQAAIWNPDGELGVTAIQAMTDSIAGHVSGDDPIGTGEMSAIVEKLASFELVNRGGKALDGIEDRFREKIDTSNIVLNAYDPAQGKIEATVNGRPVIFNSTYFPGLRAWAEAGGEAPEIPPAETGGIPGYLLNSTPVQAAGMAYGMGKTALENFGIGQ